MFIHIPMSVITLRPCIPTDAGLISEIAHKSWWHTYRPFLSKEQICFMLTELYEPSLLSQNIDRGIDFLMAEINKQAVGFISFIPKANSSRIYRIEKLYLVEEAQGIGVGKALIKEVMQYAREQRFNILELNVNRYNPAVSFYEKQGFKVVEEVDIPYHQFVLNDYVMQKNI